MTHRSIDSPTVLFRGPLSYNRGTTMPLYKLPYKDWPEEAKEKKRKRALTWWHKNKERLQGTYWSNRGSHLGQLKTSEKKRATVINRRARLLGVPGVITGEEIKSLYEAQKEICHWCPKSLVGMYHIDHMIPMSRGGTNWINNVCLSCPACNNRKHTRLPEEFRSLT